MKSLTTFLSGHVVILFPLLSIMMVDYWVLKGGRLHVSGLVV